MAVNLMAVTPCRTVYGGSGEVASHGLTKPPIAIGFSNGAIMAAALLLTRPRLLAGAILFRPLSPFRDDLVNRLHDVPVLIIDGEKDSRRSPGDGARLPARLRNAGAMVTHPAPPHLTTDSSGARLASGRRQP